MNKQQSASIGLRHSLIFATVGLIVAVLLVLSMFGVRATRELFTTFYKSIIVAVIVLYLSAAIIGRIAGAMIGENPRQYLKNGLIGIMMAELSVLISVLAGSSVEFFANLKEDGAFVDYVQLPVVWVMIFGVVPAFILGVIYSLVVGKQIAKKVSE